MRGINIGYINNIQVNINKIIILMRIKSAQIKIPKYSIIETNQTGLFNDTVVDIVPLEYISNKAVDKIDVFSAKCLESKVLCNYQYIKGYRGLNYDDLIRATTRIAQRFDDPRFFKAFYLLLQSSIDIIDDTFLTINLINILFSLCRSLIWILLFK